MIVLIDLSYYWLLMTKQKLPKKYNGKNLEEETFTDSFDEFEYAEWMVDAFYELKPEYQKLVHIYQDFWKKLRIEEYMFDENKKNEVEMPKWDGYGDLPF